jgi:hypothetical protein
MSGQPKYKTPSWYDKSKLRRVMYAPRYRGWVIDLGDGTCRFANQPMLGENGPNWGDRVKLIKKIPMDIVDYNVIIERYKPELDLVKNDK